jgi:uncharacterized membrane protein YtjA (UPF0391 family)
LSYVRQNLFLSLIFLVIAFTAGIFGFGGISVAALEGNYNVFYGLNLLCVSANFVTCVAIGAMLVTVLLNCPTGIRKAQVVFVSQYLYGDARSAASRSAKQISINPG